MDIRLKIANFPDDAPRGAVAEFCAMYRISRSWFHELRARARAEGPLAAAAPRSRAPIRRPRQTSPEVEDCALLVRKQLAEEGLDNGPISVRHRMRAQGMAAPSPATLARIFARRGAVVPAPQKRPRSSYRSFRYAAPNECWQLDGTDWELLDGAGSCILQLLDDHSRRQLGLRAAPSENGRDAWACLEEAIGRFGVPQRLLTDNGTAFNASRRGWVTLVVRNMTALGVTCITSSVGHPQTMGKDERSHQTLQRWLRARPRAGTLPELQAQLDQFDDIYNNLRPHQGLGMLTPIQAWIATPVATPPDPPQGPAPRTAAVLTRKVSSSGSVSLGHAKIQVGTAFTGQHVLVSEDGAQAHVYDHAGIHIRTLTLDPQTAYYPFGTRGGYRGRRTPAP